METYCKINNISRQLEQWFANFNTFYNIWKTPALLYNPHNDNHETRQDNHDNDCENRQSMVLEGTHVLIYHNKDRLGTGVQLIVAPFYNKHEDDDDDDVGSKDYDDSEVDDDIGCCFVLQSPYIVAKREAIEHSCRKQGREEIFEVG